MADFQLHPDKNFHYETLRSLGTSRYSGSDIQEQLALMSRIEPGDFDGWYKEWSGLAKRVMSTIDTSRLSEYSPVTVRNVFFRASHYFWVSEFFLHAKWNDSRSQSAFSSWRECFKIANANLPIPGQFIEVPAPFGQIPMYIFRTPDASATRPRPLIILGGGFDNNMEELLHVFGFDVLERGYNVLIYDGPGQPSFLHRTQGQPRQGFIHDWERVVTPIVSHILAQHSTSLSYIDTSRIALLGMSLGGYLAARAAAFEPRLAALICIDGVSSLHASLLSAMPAAIQQAWAAGDKVRFDALFAELSLPSNSTAQRWMHDHGLFAFQAESGFEFFERAQEFVLDGEVAGKIDMPAFIGDAQRDIFFQGQPREVAEMIGEKATLFEFGEENGAAAHCASGALAYQNQVIWEWFERVVCREG